MGRRLERHKVVGRRSSLYQCFETVSRGRVALNLFLALLAQYVPWFELKNWIYRRMGIKVGRGTAFGLMAMVDVMFPQLITVGEDSVIGYRTTILCHEFLVDEWRRGPVVIGNRVMVGANSTLLPGITIGDGAVISAHSLVNRDVGPGERVGGVPARRLGASSGDTSIKQDWEY